MFMFNLMILSIIMSYSMKNWMMIWFLMELNLFTFLPLMMNKINIKINSIFMMKYFFIQSFSSMIYLFTSMMMLININININIMMNLIMMMTILMKMGFYPFYYWFINLMMNMPWKICLILSTIQKLIPLIILMNMYINNYILFTLNMINSIYSTIKALNQTLIKSLLAFSSMNQLSWITLMMMFIEKFMMIYIMIYFYIMMLTMLMMKMFKLNSITDLNLKNFSNKMKLIIFMNLISISGLPPFMGFLMKWISMNLSKLTFFLMMNMMILMLMSTISLFYYLYLMLPFLIMFNYSNKMFLNKLNSYNSFMYMWIFSMIWMIIFNNLFNLN